MKEEKLEGGIVNRFEEGSNCQVFNGPISGCVFAMPGANVTQQTGRQPESLSEKEEEVVNQLKPMFFGSEEEAKAFLVSIQGMKATQIIDKVNQLVGEKKISELSKHRDLWKVLHIDNVGSDDIEKLISAFFKDGAEEVEVLEEVGENTEIKQMEQHYLTSPLDSIFHKALNLGRVKRVIADIIIIKGEEGKFRLSVKQTFILHKVLEEIDWLDDDTDTTFIQWFDDVFKWPWKTRDFKSVLAPFKRSQSMTWDENTVNDPGTGREYRQFADYVREQFVDIGQDGTIKDKVAFMNLGSDGKPMYIGHNLRRK